ncbi:Tc toxin subunit A-related protein [Methanogenium organophilum]|uniref:Peptidoglycan-binding protein n=1 Tax=Methanogenium organophilum TaxID=2199 RepID=A0A9X9S377_METOG|nr:neuraminidase-like domain-containing protein [Methanogenium organophilum]WAI00932.1 peptidoglycan-binding protein [Methanogenium organophilum]
MPIPNHALTLSSIKILSIQWENPSKNDVASLQAALKKLKLEVAPEELNKNEMGDTTKAAIRKFQEEAGLRVDGKLSPNTVEKLKEKLEHNYFAGNKTRTKKIHTLLEQAGQIIDPSEVKSRIFGKSTEEAVRQFQRTVGLPDDGQLNEDVVNRLTEEALKAHFTTKNQVGHLQQTLLRVNHIAKLDSKIDPDELKRKDLGHSTRAVITAFQKKYELEPTGELNVATYERLISVAASRPIPMKTLKVKSANNLSPIKRILRLNMTNKHVGNLQMILAYLGHKIDEKEFKTNTFGKTTRQAVLNYQRDNGLPVNGHADRMTQRSLNQQIKQVNPQAFVGEYPFLIKGCVRDDLWQGRSGLSVQVWEKPLRGEGTLLAERTTLHNGFFNVMYDPPRNPVTGQIKVPFHLLIKLIDENNNEILQSKVLFNPTAIDWINFTEGNEPYRGTSEYEVRMKLVNRFLNDTSIEDIQETENEQDITHLALNAGQSQEDVMRLLLSHHIYRKLDSPIISPEAIYAFIRQSLPSTLPSDLLGSTEEWTKIEELVDQTVNGLVFMETELQTRALNTAIKENFIPVVISQKKEQILAALSSLKQSYTLEKPILIGNGSIKSLLEISLVDRINYSKIADTFVKHKNFNDNFWIDLKDRANEFGGTMAVEDFEKTVNLGYITKNHEPTLSFLKSKNIIPRQLVKLTHKQWTELIEENDTDLPEWIDGSTLEKKKNNYAAILVSQSEKLFPALAFTAAIKTSNKHGLSNIDTIIDFLDTHPDFDLRTTNLDTFFREKRPDIPEYVRTEARVMQRVHRIAPSAAVGRVLLDEKIHSSAQIVSLGKERFVGILERNGINQRTALTIYGFAEFQYAQVLARIAEYRFELHRTNPQAVAHHTFTKEEFSEYLEDIPNLETLFGSLDFCECKHCQSVYGAPAYLTDLLRFLGNQDSEEDGKSVKNKLFERRPDIGEIKLNCENTDTPLPYIDLVCEILENAVIEPNNNGQVTFNPQTTRTKQELRAFPENICKEAYDILRTADYPMNISFDLWQEESRIFLQHLGISRYELMEAFQAPKGSNTFPLDLNIAGDFWGISPHETSIIVTPFENTQKLDLFWGFDTSVSEVKVSKFLNHAKINYQELLQLIDVKWFNPAIFTAVFAEKLNIERRPIESCDPDKHYIKNFSATQFDKIHRFLRLWRKTGWEMWELDLLIRSDRVGNGKVDKDTLIRLKQFKQLQEKLRLPFETVLSFFNQINTEERAKPGDPEKIIQPLYINLFQNPAIINPIDPTYQLTLSGQGKLTEHKSTILAALSITETELSSLMGRINDSLDLANLSFIYNHVNLARGLNVPVKDLLILLDLSGVADVFASPKQTLNFIELYEWVQKSGFLIQEIDYILNYQPDSPFGLREEVITQFIRSLRDSLQSISVHKEEEIISQISAQCSLEDDQAQSVLEQLDLLCWQQVSSHGRLQDLEQIISAIADFVSTLAPTEGGDRTQETSLLFEAINLQDRLQKQGQIISQIATSFSLTDNQARLLVQNLTLQRKVIYHLSGDKITERDSNNEYLTEITSINYPDIYNSYYLLHKASLIVKRHAIKDKYDLEWLLTRSEQFKLLDLNTLPIADTQVQPPFQPWLALYKWLHFRSQYPEPEEVSLRHIFSLAADNTPSIEDVLGAISKLTTWKEDDLKALHLEWQLQHGELIQPGEISDYANPDIYIRLQRCFNQVKRLGVEVCTILNWAKCDEDIQFHSAQQIKQVAKSKHDYSTWLSILTPFQDELRESKQYALVNFLIERSLRTEEEEIYFNNENYANPKYWQNSNDLLRYFLIDVDMSACQLTSRIKQAIGSIQMFVQRCFLNLEKPYVQISKEESEDTVSLDSWKQWKWMKNYRIWEANRKVFLYPENWIEPELRDDKSPFFEELENEILQNEITHENVETAYIHYLEKVHEVSRLEIIGIYHELDDENPNDDLPPNVNVIHVIGRTRSQPAVYYYRQFDLSYGIWTAWEKIELDIIGDHVIPVVFNRKVYLFWLIFTEKPQKIKKQPPATLTDEDAPADSPEPPKMLEIQLAWSVKKERGWASKKVSQQKLIHPWERPLFSYTLKPRYKSLKNQLWLDIYISSSRYFNNTRFYDPYKIVKGKIVKEYATAFRYDETALPWHSSSFVFDGEVVDVKLKPLAGFYRIMNSEGIASEDLVSTDSYRYVHDNFGDAGETITRMEGRYQIAPRLVLPEGMHYSNSRLTNNRLRSNTSLLNILENNSTTTVLEGAISPFEVIIAPQNFRFELSAWNNYISEIGNSLALNKDEERLLEYRLSILTDQNRELIISELAGEFSLTKDQVQLLRKMVGEIPDTRWGQTPFFYQDRERIFFIRPEWQEPILGANNTFQYFKYFVYPFYHPYAALFIRELYRSGIDGLLNRRIQLFPQSFYPTNTFRFDSSYRPNLKCLPDTTTERDIIDFSQYGAYAIYNWEIFFHAPLLIACKLSQNQRFEEAMRWFHYIFDPTNTEALNVPQRYWITKPFFEQNSEDYRKQRIENLLKNINTNLDQIRAWKNNPFKPHSIARYRPIAYQKMVVMKYIDNLVAWGDQLFRRDTIESLNEATTLYILAYELLGTRPTKIPNVQHKDLSYNEMVADGNLDPFGNKRVEVLMENFTDTPVTPFRPRKETEPLPTLDIFYFSIPNNDDLLEYWNTVEGRLFNIRHCMNIEGIVRELPLFEPPIDPALLVKAAAAGIDLSSVLSDTAVSQGYYRFRVLSHRALEFCNVVKSLGDKILSALEKKDAESLALLRSSHEIHTLEAIREVRKQQISEAKEAWAGFEKGIEVLDKKITYYESLPRMNDFEVSGVWLHGIGIGSEIAATISSTVAASSHLAPKFKAGATGFGGTPTLTVEYGGESMANASAAFAAFFHGLGSCLHASAEMVQTQGGYTRRHDENQFQKTLAEKEKVQLAKQVEAARIRYLITEKEFENEELQIEHAKSVDEYMRSKYTNQQLFNWMLNNLATVYFQSYQLAYDMAKKAEKCYQFELGIFDTSFIQFGYWDSMKKGLLAGEKLANDIHRMETSYLDEHKRQLEIIKHISLAQVQPVSLLMLKEKGHCSVTLPEWLFDMDYPGHYQRRIKSVSITIPCVVGPYTSINCTLSLTNNGVRITNDTTSGYGDPLDPDTPRFIRGNVPVQSIATSHGQNDAGVFELNFSDDRYLPFEGAGVVSEWQINLPKENNQFDFSTISDVILHIRYTAEAGDNNLVNAAKANIELVLPNAGFLFIILNHEFGNEWYRFIHPSEEPDQELVFTLENKHLPFYARNKISKLNKVDLIVESTHEDIYSFKLQLPGTITSTLEQMVVDQIDKGVHHFEKSDIPQGTPVLGKWKFFDWKIQLKEEYEHPVRKLKSDDIKNAYMIINYSIE